MNKLIIAFFTLSLFFALIEGMALSDTAYTATKITAAVSESDTDFTLYVRDTGGFPDTGYIRLGNETMEYNGKTDTTFLHCEHGARGSTAASHEAGTVVYSENTSALNDALGFTVIDTGSTSSSLNIMSFGWNFATKTVPKLVTFDYEFLHFGPLQYVLYFLLCISAGFVFMTVYMILSALGGVAQSIFVR